MKATPSTDRTTVETAEAVTKRFGKNVSPPCESVTAVKNTSIIWQPTA